MVEDDAFVSDVVEICDSEGVSYEERRQLIIEYVEAHK